MPPLEIAAAAADAVAESAEPLIKEAGEALFAAAKQAVSDVPASLVGPRNESPFLEATEFIGRQFKSGSQSIFVKANGKVYLTSYLGNPQGTLSQSHRYLAPSAARYMGVRTPEVALIDISEDFIRENSSRFPDGVRRAIKPGPAVGVLDLGKSATSVWNESREVTNRGIFGRDMVLSGFLRETDGGQFLFKPTENESQLVANRIDFGSAFGGPKEHETIQTVDLFPNPHPYVALHEAKLDESIDRLMSMPESVLTEPFKELPAAWLEGGNAEKLENTIKRSFAQRGRVPDLIKNTVYAKGSKYFSRLFKDNSKWIY